MEREKLLYQIVDRRLDKIRKDDKLIAIKHLYGVAFTVRLLALKRSLDSELLVAAALLHDLWAYEKDSGQNHARNGSEHAKKLLKNLKKYNKDEINQISKAIQYHSIKDEKHSKFDEALKDADVLQRYLMEPEKKYPKEKYKRIKKSARELGIRAKF